MSLESTIMIVVSALTAVYLVYTLLRPESAAFSNVSAICNNF